MNIIEAVRDPALFKPLFKNLDSWSSWLVVLKAIFALEMTEEEHAVFTQLTGREQPPAQQVQEAWLIVGRRGGKSFIVALIAVFLATFETISPASVRGKRAWSW